MPNLKSSKGERITREMIDSISAEVEAGHDPTTLHPDVLDVRLWEAELRLV